MSEIPRDKFDEFLEQQITEDVERVQIETEVRAYQQTVVDELDLHGVQYIWHPDKDIRQAKRDALMNRLVTEGQSSDDAEISLGRQAFDESQITLLLESCLAINAMSTKSFEERLPLLVSVFDYIEHSELDKSWLAVAESITGVSYDEYKQLISKQPEIVDQTIDPLLVNITDILLRKVEHGVNSEKAELNAAFMIGTLYRRFIQATSSQRASANLEEQLITLSRDGIINNYEFTSLLALLKSRPE